MKNVFFSILLSAGFLFLPLAASADPPHGMGGTAVGMGMMGGGMGGCGAGPMMGGGMGSCGCMMDGPGMTGLDHMAMLNLTPDQRTKLNKVKLDVQKQEWALKGKTFDLRANLRDLYSADRPDPKKIGAVYAQLFDIRRQMIEAQIDGMNKAHDLLNKDQIDKLKQLREQHEMGRCAMHEQMHDGGMTGQQ